MDTTFYHELINSITDGVYFMDNDRTVIFWNKAAERLSGYTAEEVIGSSCADNVLRHVDDDGRELCLAGCPMAATMQDGQVRETSVFMHHKLGHRVPVFVRSSPMRDNTGHIVGAVEVFSHNGQNLDILKELEALRKENLTDSLTGIGNRRYADVVLERLDTSFKEHGVEYGVLFVDIDHFKNVNDTWGHSVGDQVLRMVGQTLKAILRPLDAACRWGGEEFVILISNTTAMGLGTVAERLRMLMQKTWLEHEGEKISVTISIGGTLSRTGEDPKDVVGRADVQSYMSKEAGRNCTHIDGVKL